MALFKPSKPTEPEPPAPEPQPTASGPVRKSVPTPSRREAEAARRERLNPTLSPKEARKRERDSRTADRQRTFESTESLPQRQLMRDVVDSRFNVAEIAMPVLLTIMALTLLPGAAAWIDLALYASWAYIALIALDTFLMWRKYKALAAQRLPRVPLKGLLMYGFNRQLSFRRWRQPAPRVKRGETI